MSRMMVIWGILNGNVKNDGNLGILNGNVENDRRRRMKSRESE